MSLILINSGAFASTKRLLSICFRNGRGTKVNVPLADMWMEKAVKAKDKIAISTMETIDSINDSK